MTEPNLVIPGGGLAAVENQGYTSPLMQAIKRYEEMGIPWLGQPLPFAVRVLMRDVREDPFLGPLAQLAGASAEQWATVDICYSILGIRALALLGLAFVGNVDALARAYAPMGNS